MPTDYTEPLRAIAAWLKTQQIYAHIPSLCAGVVAGQEVVWSAGFGYADLALKTPATDRTIYSICSISKLFTSIAIMQLRDNGQLDLDDDIREHLMWFNIRQTHPKSGPVTLRSLLTHSSGLPREAEFPYWTDRTFPFPDQTQLRSSLPQQKTVYPASTAYDYSNLGMALLGDVVAVRSGMPYEAYVIEHILEPLGLADTRPELRASPGRDRMATGYGTAAPGGSREELGCFQANAIAPAVGFSSTVWDLARFAVWQFRALKEIGDPVLSGNTLREMQRTHWTDPDGTNSRGLGFAINELDGETVVGHGGGCPGYLSRFRLMPKRRWAVIVMANGLGVDVDRYADGMFRVLRSYEDDQPVESAPEVELEDYTGNYRSLWEREIIIVPWKGKLALFNLGYPDQNKPELTLRHIEGDLFRRVRDDGLMGEEVRFERDDDNQVVRYWQNSQFIDKLSQ